MANTETKQAAPSAVTKQMLRALADRLSITLPLASELVAAHVRACLDALNAGDFVAFADATYALVDGLAKVHSIIHEADPTAKAIESLDPDYWRACIEASLPKQVAHYRGQLNAKGVGVLELIARYVEHKAECVDGNLCAKHRAYVEELKARGVDLRSL